MEKFTYYDTHPLGSNCFSEGEVIGTYGDTVIKLKPEAVEFLRSTRELRFLGRLLTRSYMSSKWGGEYGSNFFTCDSGNNEDTIRAYVDSLRFFAWRIPSAPSPSIRRWGDGPDPCVLSLECMGTENIRANPEAGKPIDALSISAHNAFKILSREDLLVKPPRFFDSFLKNQSSATY